MIKTGDKVRILEYYSASGNLVKSYKNSICEVVYVYSEKDIVVYSEKKGGKLSLDQSYGDKFELIGEEKEMKKSDLRAGYVLVDEKDNEWFVYETIEDGLSARHIKNEMEFSYNVIDIKNALNDDLTSTCNLYNPNCDIIKVYGLPKRRIDILSTEGRELLWERRKEPEVLELTVSDLEKKYSEDLGREIKVKVVKE